MVVADCYGKSTIIRSYQFYDLTFLTSDFQSFTFACVSCLVSIVLYQFCNEIIKVKLIVRRRQRCQIYFKIQIYIGIYDTILITSLTKFYWLFCRRSRLAFSALRGVWKLTCVLILFFSDYTGRDTYMQSVFI